MLNQARCICDWPATCGGNGYVSCLGCGGDMCVCAACGSHGETECAGCSDCEIDDCYALPEGEEDCMDCGICRGCAARAEAYYGDETPIEEMRREVVE